MRPSMETALLELEAVREHVIRAAGEEIVASFDVASFFVPARRTRTERTSQDLYSAWRMSDEGDDDKVYLAF